MLIVGEIKLVGARRRAIDEVRHTDPAPEKLASFVRGEQSVGESGLVERAPESVSRPGEVQANGARPEARIDSDEEHVEPGRDDVRNVLSSGGFQLRTRRASA